MNKLNKIEKKIEINLYNFKYNNLANNNIYFPFIKNLNDYDKNTLIHFIAKTYLRNELRKILKLNNLSYHYQINNNNKMLNKINMSKKIVNLLNDNNKIIFIDL